MIGACVLAIMLKIPEKLVNLNLVQQVSIRGYYGFDLN